MCDFFNYSHFIYLGLTLTYGHNVSFVRTDSLFWSLTGSRLSSLLVGQFTISPVEGTVRGCLVDNIR